jgi:guanylate cyclase soluble subunit beta
LVSAAGNSLVEFLNNLNTLHDKISSTFLDYRPPTFDVTTKAGGEVDILYTSERTGLTPFVEGLMIALGQRFNEPVEVLNIESIAVDAGEKSRFSVKLG